MALSIRLKKAVAGVNGTYYFIAADNATQVAYLQANVPSTASHWCNTALRDYMIPAGLMYSCGNNAQGGTGAQSSHATTTYPRLIPHLSTRAIGNITNVMCDPSNPSVMMLEGGTIGHSGLLIYGNHAMGQGLQGGVYSIAGFGTYGANGTDIADLLAMTRMFTSYVRKTDGYLYASGRNACAQCCTGDTNAVDTWSKCNITNVIGVGEGNGNVLAVKSDGSVYCKVESDHTVGGTWQACNISEVKEICSLTYAAVALRNDGTVWYNGVLMAGELGATAQTASDGSAGNTETWKQVSGLTGITHIGACMSNFVASRKNGTQNQLVVAGANAYGHLGTGNGNAVGSFVTYNISFEPSYISVGGGGTAITTTDGDVYISGIANYVFGTDKTYTTLNSQQCIPSFTKVNEYCRTEDVNVASSGLSLDTTETLTLQSTDDKGNALDIVHTLHVKPCQYKISFDMTGVSPYTMESGKVNPYFNSAKPFRTDLVLYVGALETASIHYVDIEQFGAQEYFTEANNNNFASDAMTRLKANLNNGYFQGMLNQMANCATIVFANPHQIQINSQVVADTDYEDPTEILNISRMYKLRFSYVHGSAEVTRGGEYEYTLNCYVDNQLCASCYANTLKEMVADSGLSIFAPPYYAASADLMYDTSQTSIYPANYPYTEGIIQLRNRVSNALAADTYVDEIVDVNFANGFSSRVYIHYMKLCNQNYSALISLDKFTTSYSASAKSAAYHESPEACETYINGIDTEMQQGNIYSFRYVPNAVTVTYSNNNPTVFNAQALIDAFSSMETIIEAIDANNTYTYDNGVFSVVSKVVKNIKDDTGQVVVTVNSSDLLSENFTMQGSTLSTDVSNISSMNGTDSAYGTSVSKVITALDNSEYGLSNVDCTTDKVTNANTNVGIYGDITYSIALTYENNAYKLTLQHSTVDSVQSYTSTVTTQQLSEVTTTSVDAYCRAIRTWIENTCDSYINTNRCIPSGRTVGNTGAKIFTNQPPIGTFFCVKSGNNTGYVKAGTVGKIYFKKNDITYVA